MLRNTAINRVLRINFLILFAKPILVPTEAIIETTYVFHR